MFLIEGSPLLYNSKGHSKTLLVFYGACGSPVKPLLIIMSSVEELKEELRKLKAKNENLAEMSKIQQERVLLARQIQALKNPRQERFRQGLSNLSRVAQEKLKQQQILMQKKKIIEARRTQRRKPVRRTAQRQESNGFGGMGNSMGNWPF